MKLINWIAQFFEEDNGKPSMIRIAMLLSILVACFAITLISLKIYYSQPLIYYPAKDVQAVQVVDYEYIYGIAFLVFGLLGAVGFAKVQQKSKEANIETNK